MNKLILTIGGKRYTITLEEPYADAIRRELESTFETARDNEVKELLQAYLIKQIECLETEAKIEELLEKIPD